MEVALYAIGVTVVGTLLVQIEKALETSEQKLKKSVPHEAYLRIQDEKRERDERREKESGRRTALGLPGGNWSD